MIDYGTGYENIRRVLEHELEVALTPIVERRTRSIAALEEALRCQISIIARVLEGAFNGSKADDCSPLAASAAAELLVTLLRRLPRSAP